MKVYFVTTNEKKAEESKARLERFIERVPSQERARLQDRTLYRQATTR